VEATRFELISEIPVDVESVWAAHMIPEALEMLSPRWMGMRIVDPGDGVADGSLVRAEAGPWPFRFAWEALHACVETGRSFSFTDIALRSPFRYWVHQHVFEVAPGGRTRLRDIVWFLPPAWIPGLLGRPLVRILLRALFRWRHRVTRRALADPGGPWSLRTGRYRASGRTGPHVPQQA
jgi:ligand-binding SRPBCC domain-containing protein